MRFYAAFSGPDANCLLNRFVGKFVETDIDYAYPDALFYCGQFVGIMRESMGLTNRS